MKKQILCIGMALAVVMSLRSAEQKNKHVVQEHIAALENQLKSEAPYANERRKLIGYLRGYFNNRMHNGNKKLKRLTNANTRRLADSIVDSYEHITKTVGNHKQAATNYAQRATGVVALNVRPHAAGKVKPSMKTAPTAAEPVAKSTAKKSGGWLQEVESMMGGNENAEPAQQSVGSSRRRTGVVAAGAAGAAAGTIAASQGKKTKKPKTKKAVDSKKKQQKLNKKKNKSATHKKRTKPMSTKKKAKKDKKAAV